MKRYVLTFAASLEHKPEHPERTAKKELPDFDTMYQVWPNQAARDKTIQLQQQREHHYSDWRPCKP